MVNFPAPVGGTVLPVDFAPSIVFAVLYALLVPLTFYRMVDRRSRTILLLGTVSFSIERIVIFVLRALMAHSESKRLSNGLEKYMQVSLGMGFIGIANDLANILRCLLVNPTYGSDLYFQSPGAATKGSVVPPPPEGTPDQPRLRAHIRQWTGLLGLSFLAATVPGIIANSDYTASFDNQAKADKTATLRNVSSAIALVLTVVLYAIAWWGYRRLTRVTKKGILVLGQLTVLITTIALYRLVVMRHRTTSLTAPSVLNTPGNKAAFYILHVLPEWLTTVVLVAYNVRKTFGTGPWGDWRWQDETEKEKQKRLKREAKKREKVAKKGGHIILSEENGQNMELKHIDREKKIDTQLVASG